MGLQAGPTGLQPLVIVMVMTKRSEVQLSAAIYSEVQRADEEALAHVGRAHHVDVPAVALLHDRLGLGVG